MLKSTINPESFHYQKNVAFTDEEENSIKSAGKYKILSVVKFNGYFLHFHKNA